MRTLHHPRPRHQPAAVRRRHAATLRRAPVPPAASAQNDQAAALAALLAALGAGLSGTTARPPAAGLSVRGLTYAPPGAAAPLVTDASFDVPPRAAALLFGRSGAGKTTLLQLVAGLLKPTGGEVTVYRGGGAASPTTPPPPPPRVGLVFQFPERHFLGGTLADEMTFGWPASPAARGAQTIAAQNTLARLSLSTIPLDTPLRSLSDGYKRRVALAVQLARQPDVLLLDEPLAGLDWKARRDMVAALTDAKREATLLIVSHDLAELVPLVDAAWAVGKGGTVRPAKWPPSSEKK